jgi:hypothetical protein
MADYRQLHIKTWVDSWFMELSPEHKPLFIYLFSNQRASVCGLYELPIRVMSFETGLDRETIRKCLEAYNDADKVYYEFQTSVIWIVNMAKYQTSTSPKLRARVDADIKAVPDCELKRRFLEKYPELTISIPYRYGIDTLQSVSDSVSVEEGGVGGETRTKPVQRGDCFVAKNAPRNDMGFRGETRCTAPKSGPLAGLLREDFVPSRKRCGMLCENRDCHGLRRDYGESTLINKAEAEFIDHFGGFNGQRERQRWETLVKAISYARAQEIATWAERKEIHLINRGGLMNSLETTAEKWQERKPGGKATAEERQVRSLENNRKGIEMACAQHRSQAPFRGYPAPSPRNTPGHSAPEEHWDHWLEGHLDDAAWRGSFVSDKLDSVSHLRISETQHHIIEPI